MKLSGRKFLHLASTYLRRDTPDRLFDPNQYLAAGIHSNGNSLLRRRVMSTYHVSFFKNLCSDPTDTHSSACNGELTSVTLKALRKPQNLH
jgi:hypothetical protein